MSDSPADVTGPADAAAGAPTGAADAATMLHVDARPVVYAGTALFALGFVVLLPFWSWLGDHDDRMWLWACLAGAVLGLVGLPLVGKHEAEGRLG